VPLRPLPAALFRVLARLGVAWAAISGKKPAMTPEDVAVVFARALRRAEELSPGAVARSGRGLLVLALARGPRQPERGRARHARCDARPAPGRGRAGLSPGGG
jgi:hypothetical protein